MLAHQTEQTMRQQGLANANTLRYLTNGLRLINSAPSFRRFFADDWMKEPSFSKMYAAAINAAVSYAVTDDCKVNTLAVGAAVVIPLSLTYGRY